jgi:PAS domain S-box-containing protein
MNEQAPLYNSRIIKVFIKYLNAYYPILDIDMVLNFAGISKYEVEDQAHWFTQLQTDRFHEILVEKTGNTNIARDAGRFAVSSGALAAAQQYTLGLIGLLYVYRFMGKLYAIMSRGAKIVTKKIGSNKVEITSIPAPGVKEKLYQCENRIGTFESLAKLFTDKYATIEHPACFHKGDECCRYIVSWEKSPSMVLKRTSNYFLILTIVAIAALYYTLPRMNWMVFTLLYTLITWLFFLYSSRLEKNELTRTIETQGNVAEDLLKEIEVRHNNSLLVQEIGQALSTILNIDELIKTVVNIMVKRMVFNRGLIMLTNKEKTRLVYSAGYGYDQVQEELLKQTEFHIDNPASKGPFVVAFNTQSPFQIDDIEKIEENLSPQSLELTRQMGVQSLMCVPILYEKEALGILAVDNIESKKAFTQSDRHLLKGVASQAAVGIVNARSFQKVQESEKKYRELVESANSIILRMDTEGKITFFNEFAQKFFGYKENEIIGRDVQSTILLKSESTKRNLQRLFHVLRQDPDRQIVSENENVLRNGQIVWITWTYKPIFSKNGRLNEVLCIGNDITELRRAEQDKKDLEVQLQRAQKMEAIGTLAGGVAHDLNNILTGLVSYPELLLMEIPEESPLRKPMLTIQKSGEKASAIVQDLLTLARRGVSVMEVVNFNQILSEYLRSLEFKKMQLNHPDVQVRHNSESDLLNISGSSVHLSKMIMNLVSNAAEAMPGGGEIIISTANRYVDSVVNGYENIEEGDYITLSVADTGIGISPQDQERIFEPFFTKKVLGKSGTGLGMAVVWGTVKDHHGFIDFQSTEEKGTTFTLYFPVTRQEITKDTVSLSIEEYMGNGERILVVDDRQEQREIASRMLEKLAYHSASVSSGEEAVAYVKRTTVNLIVLDMIMDPGIDGLETYKRILEVRPGMKAIIASGFSETERVKEAQSLGAGAYVKKPYTLEKLGVAVKNELL